MKFLLLTIVCYCCLTTSASAPEAEWRFCAMKNSVWFYWQLDEDWQMLQVKAHNKSIKSVQYTYQLMVYDGDNLLHQQNYRFTNLKSKDFNIFKVGRQFNYVSHVKLNKLDVRMDN